MKKHPVLCALTLLPLLMLGTSAEAFDINGTYTSEDGNFILTITDSDDFTGQLSGTYLARYTPVGPVTGAVTGSFRFINHPNGSLTPLVLSFTSLVRPDPWPYVLMDSWSGILTQTGQMSVTGVRHYLPVGSPGVMTNLGTHTLGF